MPLRSDFTQLFIDAVVDRLSESYNAVFDFDKIDELFTFWICNVQSAPERGYFAVAKHKGCRVAFSIGLNDNIEIQFFTNSPLASFCKVPDAIDGVTKMHCVFIESPIIERVKIPLEHPRAVDIMFAKVDAFAKVIMFDENNTCLRRL